MIFYQFGRGGFIENIGHGSVALGCNNKPHGKKVIEEQKLENLLRTLKAPNYTIECKSCGNTYGFPKTDLKKLLKS